MTMSHFPKLDGDDPLYSNLCPKNINLYRIEARFYSQSLIFALV